jgi:outer membrane protein assembly factor BamB
MRHRFISYICFVIIGLSSLVQGEDWAQFRGPDFGRASQAKIAQTWNTDGVDWKTALPGRGASSPVVFGDHIYLTAYTGYAIDKKEPGDPKQLVRHLLCLDVNSGQLLWQKSIADDSPKDKFATWGTAKAGYASGSAATDASGVYILFGATGVVAFDHDGEELWRTFCGDDVHDYPGGTSPILYKDLVVVNASYQSGALIALKKSDGSEVWRQEGIIEAWNTPIVYKSANGEDELAVSAINEIRAVDPQTGKLRWTCTGIDEYVCPSLIAENGVLYSIGGKKGVAIAVGSGGTGDVTETHKRWQSGKGSNVSSPVYHDGHLYWAKDKGGVVYCVNAQTGAPVYQQRLKPGAKSIYATPLLAGGRLYYISREKGIFVVAATPEFKLLSHSKLDGDDSIFSASPVPLEDGAVLLRSDKFLYRMKPAK